MMMAAVSTSQTSVNFYQTTRRNIPEDSHLHTRHRENPKSHKTGTFHIDSGVSLKSYHFKRYKDGLELYPSFSSS
jgi:hypothetical protein